VVSALLQHDGVDCPVVVLGGGTANAFAETLGAPPDLDQKLGLLCEGRYEYRDTDVGMVKNRGFLLRASVGATAGLTDHTDREEKERLGLLAYCLSGLRAASDARVQCFRLETDGAVSEHDAVSVVVANSAGTGLGSEIAEDIRTDDRRLHALVVPSAAWLTRALANAAIGRGLLEGCVHLRGDRIRVACEVPVAVHLDGEAIEDTPVSVHLRPAAIRVAHYLSPET
jgi:diacylglycerol kinase family enzyme